MHYRCAGSGEPTLVLAAGIGGGALDWSELMPALAQDHQVCAFDRLGQDWSDPAPQPRAFSTAAAELHYYHFRNKEEIIHALFEQQFALWDVLYTLPDDRLPTLADMQHLVRATFAMSWDYRFSPRHISSHSSAKGRT